MTLNPTVPHFRGTTPPEGTSTAKKTTVENSKFATVFKPVKKVASAAAREISDSFRASAAPNETDLRDTNPDLFLFKREILTDLNFWSKQCKLGLGSSFPQRFQQAEERANVARKAIGDAKVKMFTAQQALSIAESKVRQATEKAQKKTQQATELKKAGQKQQAQLAKLKTEVAEIRTKTKGLRADVTKAKRQFAESKKVVTKLEQEQLAFQKLQAKLTDAQEKARQNPGKLQANIEAYYQQKLVEYRQRRDEIQAEVNKAHEPYAEAQKKVYGPEKRRKGILPYLGFVYKRPSKAEKAELKQAQTAFRQASQAASEKLAAEGMTGEKAKVDLSLREQKPHVDQDAPRLIQWVLDNAALAARNV